MGGLLSSPKPPDTSAIDKQRAEAEAKAEEEKLERKAREKAMRAGASGVGRRSLLGGDEKGVTTGPKEKLG